jgi:hypothetical protein
VRPGEGKLHDLLEGHLAVVNVARTRVDDGLGHLRMLRRGDEPLDPGLRQVDQVAALQAAQTALTVALIPMKT